MKNKRLEEKVKKWMNDYGIDNPKTARKAIKNYEDMQNGVGVDPELNTYCLKCNACSFGSTFCSDTCAKDFLL